jgi:hypothetical protein
MVVTEATRSGVGGLGHRHCVGAVGSAIALTFGAAAEAASDGNVGATSTGSVAIRASVANRVQLSGAEDISFTTTASSNAFEVQVWSRTPTNRFHVSAVGSGPGGEFILANGVAPAIHYSVDWGPLHEPRPLPAAAAMLSADVPRGRGRTPTGAAPVATARLVVGIAGSDVRRLAESASYTGTLTLVVAPE